METSGQPWLAIRADGNRTIGTGHVMRCLALAATAMERGLAVRWLARNLHPTLATRITGAGITLCRLPDASAAAVGSGNQGPDTRVQPYAHSNWLGVSEHRDAHDSLDGIRALIDHHAEPELIVVDHYALGADWHERIRGLAPVLAIDELLDRQLAPDWLLDQTPGRSADDYRARVAPHTQFLLGGGFALLRAEFARTAVRLGHRREPPDGLLRVLVSMGGVDAGNATALAVRGLDIAVRRIPTAGTIVVGDAYPHREALESLIDSVDVPIELVTRCNHMAALMAEHDIAIGAAGTSAWERCATGLPALNLVLAANQLGIAAQIETAGAAMNLGSAESVDAQQIADQLCALHADPVSYSRMVRAAFGLVDGHGCQRMLDAVLTGA